MAQDNNGIQDCRDIILEALHDYRRWFADGEKTESDELKIKEIDKAVDFFEKIPEGRYKIYNTTDGILATQETFETIQDAKDFIKAFLARFEKQGYYLTARKKRIPIDCVDFEIVEEK